MCSDVAIRAHGLGKVYKIYDRPHDRLKELIFHRRSFGREFWALRDIDFEVRRGETIGIIGRNGSGKSTLLQLVCGTLQPTTGELEVRGRVAALLELGAGFNPDFTGRENVYLSATVLGLSEAEIDKRFAAIAAFAEIGDFIEQPVRQYSSGMYARLAFAVCAHVDADIMVVDEILSVGDAGFQQRCMRFLNAFRARGTLLFVSHDEGSVLSLCDRAVWLDRGILRASGVSREVCRRYRTSLAQSNGSGDAFQTGGEPEPLTSTTALGVTSALKPFDFNLDAIWSGGGKGMIESANLMTTDGEASALVEGGSEVTVRIIVRAGRDLDWPVVAFVLRNRLGQTIISDSTALLLGTVKHIEQGCRFAATFHFRLPHLPNGDYAIEPALFERYGEGPVDKLLDSLFVRVNSDPALEGLANLPMRRIRMVFGNGPARREIAVASPEATQPVIEDSRWGGRNPIEIMPFNSAALWHGHGGAKIEDASFFSPDGQSVAEIQGGKEVELRIRARAERAIDGPILGFILRNSLGQNVCGDNTFAVTRELDRRIAAGELVTAFFSFQMPYLPTGVYALAPSIIDGTQSSHLHLHWLEEALILRVSESPVGRSVIGVPMIDISLEPERVNAGNQVQ